jgi:hypothetical protein
MDLTAIVHFVGICVFTTQIAGPYQTTTQMAHGTKAFRLRQFQSNPVTVIMPRVESDGVATTSTTIHQKTTLRLAAPAPAHGMAQSMEHDVETHTAMLVYETSKYLASSGWTSTVLPNSTFEYIDLNNDQISFVANGANPVAEIPTLLGHIGGGGTMKAAYMPPAYTGAAAVFTIPRGLLSVCISQAGGVSGRRDTRLRLNNSGTLTITSGAKSLTLVGDAEIYAVNVPKRYVQAHATGGLVVESAGANHMMAYCRMTGTEQNCAPPVVKDQTACPVCDENKMRTPYPVRVRPGEARLAASVNLAAETTASAHIPNTGEGPQEMNSFECSNTQWP